MQAGFPMGSLGGLYTQSSYIHSKGLLSDFYEFNLGADMGNYCSFTGAGNKKAPSPPHTLEELLYEIGVKDDISAATVDQMIGVSPWANKFRQYLKSRNLSGDETILRFLVLIQPLKSCANFNNNNHAQILGHSKIHHGLTESDRKRLFVDIFDTFLSEESEDVLPLSNQALWGDLLATSNSIKAGLSVSMESIMEITQVRKDPGIWDEGIEPTYMRFLRQAPPPTLTACIMSIL